MFLLKKSSCKSTVALQADFSPLVQKEEQPSGSSRTLPTFNLDRLHFTPSFILAVDQVRPFLLRNATSRTESFMRNYTCAKLSRCLNKRLIWYK